MLIVDFLAMVLLYFVHRMTKTMDKDIIGDYLFLSLMAFGGIFLFIDMLDKIKGLF